MKPLNLKIQLHQKCCELAKKRVITIKSAQTEVQEAANNETKSSAGDKHETGRAMAQLESEKLSVQLIEALKLEQTLLQINLKEEQQQIAFGSLIITNYGNFYIAVSLGKITIKNQYYFSISAISPIGKQLIGLKTGDVFSFNNKNYKVLKII